MQDFFMGAQVELEELALGEAPPAVTPPQGVILTELHTDGWTRRYLYKSRVDALGKAHPSKILVSEIPGDPPAQMGAEEPSRDHEVPISRPVRVGMPSMMGSPLGTIPIASAFQTPISGMPSPAMGDSRVNLPAHTAVPLLRQGAFLGQIPPSAPMTPPAPAMPADTSVPLANATPPDPSAPAPVAAPDSGPLALPACSTVPLQLPDGTIINPDDAITLKDFCALVPYLEKLIAQNAPAQQNGPVRPGGPIPLSRGFPGLPSFGPAGSGFAQGGFGGAGGGGGGNPPGAGPIGVVTGPVPTGGQGQGTQGPPGPAGPPGPGTAPLGVQKTDGNFENTGAMAPIPGLSLTVPVGGNGNVTINFSGVLVPAFLGQIFDVFAGIQIDGGTPIQVWRQSEEQGAGGDGVFAMTMVGTLFVNLTPGDHTITVCYGDNPGENHFVLATSPTSPASLTVQSA